MSCFWDSLIKTIQNDDLNTYFDNQNIRINPHNLATILKNVNKKTPDILWNNTELTEKSNKLEKNDSTNSIEN